MSSTQEMARAAVGALESLRTKLQAYFDAHERSINNPEHDELLGEINDLDTAIQAAALDAIAAQIGADAQADVTTIVTTTTKLVDALDHLDAQLASARRALAMATAGLHVIAALTTSPFSLASLHDAVEEAKAA
jgi:enamine deaminase RidA (YjgF/YER057c/UK114 family)